MVSGKLFIPAGVAGALQYLTKRHQRVFRLGIDARDRRLCLAELVIDQR